nr:cytochrome P450 [Kibdelosporangium sp. MJ126-NF4]CEL17425.1 cytochrome P450 [Kibdelosporangium sp. MJ126-NF4]CTQ91348.1 cytochrome P450 [Kibdelosporangium sp. MJ126-NF4]
MTLPPGPPGHPVFGSSLGFRRDPLGTFLAGWRDYGGLVRFRGPFTVFLVSDPDHLKHILVDNFENYPHPDRFDSKVSVAVGRGLVTTSGADWRRQRDLVEPAFHRAHLAGFVEVMAKRSAMMLDRWADGGQVDVQVEMQGLTMEILTRCLFDADWSDDAEAVGRAVRTELEHLNRKLVSVVDLPEWVPTPNNRRFVTARKLLDRLVYRLIAERRAAGPGGDVLSMLMADMSDRQLRDQVKTLFVAGHETAAATLTWVWYLLGRHPEVTRRVRAELDEVLAGRPPSMSDIPNLKYLRMVLQEVLRLYPPLWQVPRMPLRDDEIGGYHVPAGSFLLLSTYIAHRDPSCWDNPEGFDPERFTRHRSAGRPRYAYLPYAGGPRDCAGMAFANMELAVVVATVLQRFTLELVPGHPVEPQPDLALRAKYGLPMVARRVS